MTDEQTDRELMRALLDGETLIGPDGIRLRLGDDDMLETRRMGTNPDWTKRPRMLSAGKISWSTLKRSRGRASSRYRRVVFGELTTSEKALSYSYLLDERDSGYVATVVEWPSISAGGESRRAASGGVSSDCGAGDCGM